MADRTPDQLTAATVINNDDLMMVYPTGGPLKKMAWSVLLDIITTALSSMFLTPAGNLSGINSPSAARDNIGAAAKDNTVLTGDPTAPTAGSGDNDTSIATTAFVQNAAGGATSVNVAGSANVTLTAAQAGANTVILTGALTGNINVIFPTQADAWVVVNRTSGAYTITVKHSATAGVLIPQGKSRGIYSDGTTVAYQQTDYNDVNPTKTGKGAYLIYNDSALVGGNITVSTSAAPGSGTYAEGDIWLQTS